MDKFKRYFNRLKPAAKVKFCNEIGLSRNYVAKVMAGRPQDNYKFGPLTCSKIEELTKGRVKRKSLREDWRERWPELAKKHKVA